MLTVHCFSCVVRGREDYLIYSAVPRLEKPGRVEARGMGILGKKNDK